MSRVRIQCPGCQQQFQIDRDRTGKKFRCPKCQTSFFARQIESNEKRTRPKAQTSQSGDPGKVPGNDQSNGLLPPVFEIASEVEERVLARLNVAAPSAVPSETTEAIDQVGNQGRKPGQPGKPITTAPGILLGIDAGETSIQKDGKRIPLQAVSAEKKRIRRRIRVTIVYLVCVVLLIVWFLWLLRRSQ